MDVNSQFQCFAFFKLKVIMYVQCTVMKKSRVKTFRSMKSTSACVEYLSSNQTAYRFGKYKFKKINGFR